MEMRKVAGRYTAFQVGAGAIFLLIFFACSRALNQTVNGQQEGLWITYADSGGPVLTEGKFKKGIPVGKWIYNTPEGKPDHTERYRGTKISIRHFYPNGRPALKGKARLVNGTERLHFYYYGKWRYYLENGEPEKTAWFENGKLVREEYAFKGKSAAYDSLVDELRAIDKDYIKYRDTLLKAEKTGGRKSEQYLRMKKLYEQNDSLVLLRIDKIIRRFGYPSSKLTGGTNSVIFFIISNAAWPVKERFFEVFKSAAKKGDISLKDMAFFEDKLYSAREGWQVYGTQFKMTKENHPVYYPVKDLSELNERRHRAGLEVVNLMDYQEKK